MVIGRLIDNEYDRKLQALKKKNVQMLCQFKNDLKLTCNLLMKT